MKDWLTGFWYPVARQQDLTVEKQPLQVTVLGERLALFLDDQGSVAAVHDICPHLGASLSLGTVCDGKIVCPYHHFRFLFNGRCDHIPGQPDGNIPHAMAVDSYPTQVRYGLIWVFLGDSVETERPPLVEIPEFDQAGFFSSVASEFTWSGALRPMVENLIDFSHFGTLHGTSFGSPGHYVTERYPVTSGKYDVSAEVTVKLAPGNGIFPATPDLGENPDVKLRSRFHMPTVVVNSFLVGPYNNTTLWTFTPKAGPEVVIRSIGVRNYQAGSGTDQDLASLGKQIYEEDRMVVESCIPEVLPACIPALVDHYLFACRQLYDGFLAQPGRTAHQHSYATLTGARLAVIPSPTRHTNAPFAYTWQKRSDQEPR